MTDSMPARIDMFAFAGGRMAAMSAYDAAAPSFERHRALPDGVPQAIRSPSSPQPRSRPPRLLDLGAGTGRIGEPFVAAGDDYVAVDLSLGMLREFACRGRHDLPLPRLAQADGQRLPFPDANLRCRHADPGVRRHAGMAARDRRSAPCPAPRGALVTGRSVAPVDGIDAQMKRRLGALLADLGVEADAANARDDVHRALESQAQAGTSVVAWTWNAERTARAFLDAMPAARASRLCRSPSGPRRCAGSPAGAMATFGSLDRVFSEPHCLRVTMLKFVAGDSRHA